MIPDSFKQDLLNRVDIVDVVSPRVALKKSGANWVGLCPFHGEKTPSFSVSAAKQFYHCFGCGAHGNAIGFLMEYGGLGYVEAVKELAESVGLKLPELQSRGPAKPEREGPDLYELLQRAARFYHDQLKASARAIEYLKGRGVSGQTAARYHLGVAPPGWQSLAAAFERYEDKALVECGLVVENEGKRYDRFRDRVMFPILNQRGLVIGFGGRVIAGDDGPKYMNSPETPVFEKGRELYGLPQARDAIRAANRVVVVEGYMDVVMLAQHGVQNAVATLGTSTTPTHVQKLLRQADEIVFCFDGDAAGRRAAWHALEVSLETLADHKTVRFLFLPPEHDPDSYVREFGHAAFEAKLDESEPLSAYLLRELKGRVELATLEGRSKLIAEAKPLVKRLAAPGLRVQLVKALATAAAMEPVEAARLLEVRDGVVARTVDRPAPARADRAPMRGNEATLLRAILGAPELAQGLNVELVRIDAAEGEVLRFVADWVVGHADALPRPLSTAFEGQPFYPLLARLEATLLEFKLEPEDFRAEFEGAVRNLERDAKSREINEMLARNERKGLPERLREKAGLHDTTPASDLARSGGTPI
ncbi:MAG TPA: DNA primase [Burkholderiales bacterium]|nr:DNA primase [Burkholderiales bacterium]